MIRTPILVAAAASGAAVLALAGAVVARADNLFDFGRPQPAVETDVNTPAQDRLLAKAAFTTVLERRAEVLGMTAPVNLAPYAPIYPQGFISDQALPPNAPGGRVQYAAPAPLRAVMDFYEDAAAAAHMPFTARATAPDTLVLTAGDARRGITVTLTRQFANSTVVDLHYS